MTALIKAHGLRKTYGKLIALDGVDFEIEPGRIVGLIGPNGAGKTTLMKATLGLVSCQGSLQVLGMDPFRQRAELMKDVCFIADVAVLPPWLKVRNALEFMSQVHPRFRPDRARDFLSRTKIRMNSKVKTLSKGMIVQLHLALVMAIDVRLLVLDEPTLGLDILYRKAFYETLINDYFDEQRTILVTTHQVEEIEHILTDLMFIQDGRIVLDESMEDVAKKYVEVLVRPEHSAAVRALGPIHERKVFGKDLFLFEGHERERLGEYGDLHTPSVADLFVAKLERAAA